MSDYGYDMWLAEFARRLDSLNYRLNDKSMSLGLDCVAYFRGQVQASPARPELLEGHRKAVEFQNPEGFENRPYLR